jgi:calnexin
MIDNPAYQGIWAPQQIPNPEYFELEKPNLEAVAAIGIEIWTMQDGILFDNILVAHDEKVAEEYRKTTWEPKYLIEKEKDAAEAKVEKVEKSAGVAGIKVHTDILRTCDCFAGSMIWSLSTHVLLH